MPKYKISNPDGGIVEYIEAAQFIFQGGTFLFMDERRWLSAQLTPHLA